jgi:hypothetical protein
METEIFFKRRLDMRLANSPVRQISAWNGLEERMDWKKAAFIEIRTSGIVTHAHSLSGRPDRRCGCRAMPQNQYANPLQADIRERLPHVRDVPTSDIGLQ